MLREIQRTGDIFFPKRWVDATLSGHSSQAAARSWRRSLRRCRPITRTGSAASCSPRPTICCAARASAGSGTECVLRPSGAGRSGQTGQAASDRRTHGCGPAQSAGQRIGARAGRPRRVLADAGLSTWTFCEGAPGRSTNCGSARYGAVSFSLMCLIFEFTGYVPFRSRAEGRGPMLLTTRTRARRKASSCNGTTPPGPPESADSTPAVYARPCFLRALRRRTKKMPSTPIRTADTANITFLPAPAVASAVPEPARRA